MKFILWSRGGWRISHRRPGGAGRAPGAPLPRHRRPAGSTPSWWACGCSITRSRSSTRRALPAERSTTRPLGRHLEGCRIGFDLGGSDRKVAAVIDGRVVFSEETVWDPYHKPDPQYHIDGIMDSLAKAAAHLPRVDAIGGSAAGVYVNNRVKAGSLFRGVPQDAVRRAREGPVPRDPAGLARRAVRGRQRRRGDGAGRLDVARQERDPRHRAGHQHRRRLRDAGRQHHVVAQRAGVCAGGLQPRGASRRVVGRLRRRLAVLLAAGRGAAAGAGRHRGAGRPAAAREAEARPGADGERRRAGAADLPDASARTWATASRTSPTSTICGTCWSWVA